MNHFKSKGFLKTEISGRLKWLMFCRLIFSIIVISGIYLIYVGQDPDYLSAQVVGLYFFSALIIILSLLYAFLFKHLKNTIIFSVVQIIIDTFLVTFLIYFTGVYSSVFQFFYLIIILYSSSVFTKGKAFWVAGLVSTQYSLLISLKYNGILEEVLCCEKTTIDITGGDVFFQAFFFIVSSFAVAWLTSLLSLQVRRARDDLRKMDEYVKRVERLAYAGEIAAGFAHEIKNPMASLRGSIQLLVSDILKDEKKDVEKLGEIILRESDRLDQLVNSFLFFAKPGHAGGKKIDCERELEDIVKIFRQDPRVKNHHNIFYSSESEAMVEMDPGHFKQIIWNIVINALDASPEGGDILISLRNKKNIIEIVVEDFGEGIPDEISDRIFDPFFSTKKRGSGLGLSIVARLIELYEGSLEIKGKSFEKGTLVIIGFNSV